LSFLLLSVAAIASAELRSLIAFEKHVASETFLFNELATAFDMRAAYPSLTIFVATKEQQSKLETLLETKATVVSIYSTAVDYHVVFGDCASLKLQSVFGKGAIMIGTKGQAILMGPKGKGLSALEELVDPHEDVCSRNLLPTTRIRAPRRSKYFPKAGAVPKNPQVIQELTDQVNQGRLEYFNNLLAFNFGDPNSRNSNSVGLDEAVAWAVQNFTAMGLQVTTVQHPQYPGHSPNVIASLPGLTDAWVIAHAHLDSRNTGTNDVSNPAPGADDNGSGSSAVLEMAGIITGAWRAGQQFQYGIQFCLWTGEEQGLLGSRYYASQIADDNVDVIAAINSDMIGYRVNINSILSLMSGSATPSLNNLIDDIVVQYVPEIDEVGRTNACCSDQQSFWENGYDSAGFFEHEGGAGSYPCYHQQCDLPDEVDFPMLTENTRAAISVVLTLAEPL